MNITKPQLKKLFVFATSQTYFLFNNEIYDQTDGVAMGSPLGPALAILFWVTTETNGLILKEFQFCFISDMWMTFFVFLCVKQIPNVF